MGEDKRDLGTPQTPAASRCTITANLRRGASHAPRTPPNPRQGLVPALSFLSFPQKRESMSVLGGPRFVVAAEPSRRVDRAKRNPPPPSPRSRFNPLGPPVLGADERNLGTPQTPAASRCTSLPPFLGGVKYVGGHPQTPGSRMLHLSRHVLKFSSAPQKRHFEPARPTNWT
jgi:hypothetical protein